MSYWENRWPGTLWTDQVNQASECIFYKRLCPCFCLVWGAREEKPVCIYVLPKQPRRTHIPRLSRVFPKAPQFQNGLCDSWGVLRLYSGCHSFLISHFQGPRIRPLIIKPKLPTKRAMELLRVWRRYELQQERVQLLEVIGDVPHLPHEAHLVW